MFNLIKKYYLIISVTLAGTIAGLLFYLNLYSILTYLAPDHEVKAHLVSEVGHYVITLYTLFVLMIIIFSLRNIFVWLRLKILSAIRGIRIDFSKFENILIIILFMYILISSFITVFSFDISTDEATYIYTIQHYYEHGVFLYKTTGNEFLIPKDMFGQNLIVMLIKPFTEFSVYIPRLISYFYSIAVLFLLFFIILKNYKKTASLVFLVLFAAYPGFMFISGSSFGENIGIFYLMIGLILYSKFQSNEKYPYLILSSVFISVAILTKLQLGFFIYVGFGILIIINFFKNEKLSSEIKLLVITAIFTVLILMIFFISLYDIIEVKRVLATFFLVGSSGVAPSEPLITSFINFERFFNFQTILLASLSTAYFLMRKYKKSYIERLVFSVVIVNAIWFVLLKGHGFRFMYFAQFGLMLVSVVPITKLFINNENPVYRKIIVLFLSFFLTLGIIQNTTLTLDGVSNNALIYLNGNNPFKTYHKFVKNNDQKEFYEILKNYITEKDDVFLIGAESELMAHIPNKFFVIDPDNFNAGNFSGKYVIYTAINTQLDINQIYEPFIKNNCVLIFKKGDYCLYKIK